MQGPQVAYCPYTLTVSRNCTVKYSRSVRLGLLEGGLFKMPVKGVDVGLESVRLAGIYFH